jgi:hypothetical protein
MSPVSMSTDTDTDNLIAWIDRASYEQLFERWRFAPLGEPLFQGDVGDHYTAVMSQRRAEVGPVEHSATSKRIGWER